MFKVYAGNNVGKNLSLTLNKNKAKLEYINEEQPSPLELAFGIESAIVTMRQYSLTRQTANHTNTSWFLVLLKSCKVGFLTSVFFFLPLLFGLGGEIIVRWLPHAFLYLVLGSGKSNFIRQIEKYVLDISCLKSVF